MPSIQPPDTETCRTPRRLLGVLGGASARCWVALKRATCHAKGRALPRLGPLKRPHQSALSVSAAAVRTEGWRRRQLTRSLSTRMNSLKTRPNLEAEHKEKTETGEVATGEAHHLGNRRRRLDSPSRRHRRLGIRAGKQLRLCPLGMVEDLVDILSSRRCGNLCSEGRGRGLVC